MNPEDISTLFKSKTGSGEIAGRVTLREVVRFCREHKPRAVLELGGGIGTISYAVLSNCDAVMDIYEHNDFCIAALGENLKEYKERIAVLSNYLTLPPKREYDLVIVDGGKGKHARDGGFPRGINAYIHSLDSLKTIFIEGERKSQRFWVTQALRTRFTYTPQKYYDAENKKKGMLRIDCEPSSNELLRLVNHWYWRKRIY